MYSSQYTQLVPSSIKVIVKQVSHTNITQYQTRSKQQQQNNNNIIQES